MISWSTAQSLLIFFGPILLPRFLAFYRSLRAPSNARPIPLSTSANIALNILLLSSIYFLLTSTPLFSPSNIFHETQSRLQAPSGVLFTRLAKLRPDGLLTASESRLRNAFETGGLEARLLYARFGPDALTNCVFVEDPRDANAATTYFFYVLPGIAAVHVAHLLVLGLVTAPALTGRNGSRWRLVASIAGVVLGVAEAWAVGTYDHQLNARAKTLREIDFFHWKVRVVRGVACATIDGLLGWLIWLGATRRAFLQPPSGAEMVEQSTKVLEASLARLRGLGAVRNVVYRDRAMRANVERYWVHEDQVMRHIMEDQDVARAMADVLATADVANLRREADGFVTAMLPEHAATQ